MEQWAKQGLPSGGEQLPEPADTSGGFCAAGVLSARVVWVTTFSDLNTQWNREISITFNNENAHYTNSIDYLEQIYAEKTKG